MKSMIQKVEIILKGTVVFLFFYFSYLFQFIPVYLFHLDISQLSGNIRMAALFSTFSSLATLFWLLIFYQKDLIHDFQTYLKKFKENFDVGFYSWVSGLFLMIAVNYILISFFHANGANNENVVRQLSKALPVVMGLDICLIAPVVEELVFRKTLKDIFHNPYLFILFSFLLFGLAHVFSSAKTLVDWLYVVPYGIMGGAFAYADYKTDTIFTSIVFHIIHNTVLFFITLML